MFIHGFGPGTARGERRSSNEDLYLIAHSASSAQMRDETRRDETRRVSEGVSAVCLLSGGLGADGKTGWYRDGRMHSGYRHPIPTALRPANTDTAYAIDKSQRPQDN